MKYNESQSEAIRHKDGPMLVIAGPGSGKTSTLCRRVYNLNYSYQIPEKKILVLTFTKNAAEHMRQEYLKLKGEERCDVMFCTIHSLCYKILSENLKTKLNIITEREKLKIIKRLLASTFKNDDIDITMATDVGDLISFTTSNKNRVFNGKKYENGNITAYFGDMETFLNFYNKYTAYKEKERIFDFDDLIFKAYELLSEKVNLRLRWQNEFSYVLVDEFQDTNDHEFDLIMMLVENSMNIFAVGDDDQSIYGFRGANPLIMKRFLKEYPKSKTVYLDINYRSTKEITDISNKLICKNKTRMEKTMHNAVCFSKGRVLVKRYADAEKQYEELIEDISRRINEGTPKEDIAVLFRTNYLKNAFLEKTKRLETNGDNCYSAIKTEMIEEIISLFKVVSGEFTAEDVIKSMNIFDEKVTSYYMPKNTKELYLWADIVEKCDDRDEIAGVEEYLSLITTLKKVPPYVGINLVLNNLKYKEKIRRQYRTYAESLDNYRKIIFGFKNLINENFTYNDAIIELNIVRSSKDDANCGRFNVLTLHESKGLEFDTVYIPDINEGIIPNKKAKGEEETEEERRLLYVGLTRAKNNLILSFSTNKSGKNLKASGFIKEILKY
ncbi:MAG: ATP-dependent helicase [Lachnospiraceae bacterium]|nr:ATP-dependent helicase [Lachnospiraceae bacterium]